MFVDEVKRKLDLDDVVCSFSVATFGNSGVAIEGVRTLVFVGENEIKVKVKKTILSVLGEELKAVEIGGGNLYIKGNINGIAFEKQG